MKPRICPYLGLRDDPSTSLSFPSEEGNYCHGADSAAPIKAAHQSQYCLSDNHRQCPVYLAAKPTPMPAPLAAPAGQKSESRIPRLYQLAGLFLIAGILAVGSLFTPLLNIGGIRSAIIPQTGQEAEAPGWNLFTINQPEANIPVATQTPTAEQQAQVPNCPIPPDWVPYLVAPTDSLFRLSVLHQVSVEELQRANCMEEDTVILPGQTLFLPVPPTPEPTITPKPVVVVQEPVPAQPEEDEPEADQPQPPAPVPPTNTPEPPPPTQPVVDPPSPAATEAPITEPPPPPSNDDQNEGEDKDDDRGGGDKGGGNDNDGDKDKDKDKDKGNGGNDNGGNDNGGNGNGDRGNGNGRGRGGGRDRDRNNLVGEIVDGLGEILDNTLDPFDTVP